MKIKKIIRSISAPKETFGVLWVSPDGLNYFEEGVWKAVDAAKFMEINNKLEDLSEAISNLPTTPPVVIPTPGAGTAPPDSKPSQIGLFYIDLSAESGGLYYSVGSDTVGDWRQA